MHFKAGLVAWLAGGAKLEYANVGSLKFSPLGIGTWSWGNKLLWGYQQKNDDQLQEVFDFCLENGINWFDTADSYGTGALEGRSEELLGQFLGKYGHCSDFKQFPAPPVIATKLAPYPWRVGSQSMVKACQDSVNRINSLPKGAKLNDIGEVRPLDVLQLHWPPPLQWQQSAYFDAFASLIKGEAVTSTGGAPLPLAREVGLSNFGPAGLRAAHASFADRGVGIASNQVQFSLLSRYPLSNGLMEASRELDVQLIAYTPLAFGLLTDKYSLDSLPDGPRQLVFKEFLPLMEPLLKTMRAIAASYPADASSATAGSSSRGRGRGTSSSSMNSKGLFSVFLGGGDSSTTSSSSAGSDKPKTKTVAQVGLNWVVCKGALPVVGMRSVEQARENLGAVSNKWRLKADEVEELDRIAAKIPKQTVQNIFQTP